VYEIMTHLTPDEMDMLAAEYVLGALDTAERARAEHLAKTDASFALQIADWQARLGGLNADYADVPAPDLMPQIEARLFGTAAQPARWGWLRNLARRNWGWMDGLAGTAVLTAASVLLLALMLSLSPAPVLTATLRADASPVQFSAHLEDGTLTLTHTQGSAALANHSYELWIIQDGAQPVSLGLIDGTLTLPAPDAAIGYVLAVTDEPLGGGPGGKPTGPVIAAGKFEDI
jgi:anti-sigma-K factor RskA